jgi:hypothetical protein
MPRAAKETTFDIGDVTCNLGIHRLSGWGVMPAMWTDREAMSMKSRT